METKINFQKLLIGTIVTGIVLFGVGAIWHMVLFFDYYHPTGSESFIGRGLPNLPVVAFANLLEGFVLAWFYLMAYPNGSTFVNSLVFGHMVGAIGFSIWGLTNYAVLQTPHNWLSMAAGFSFAQGVLAGFALLLVTGKKTLATA